MNLVDAKILIKEVESSGKKLTSMDHGFIQSVKKIIEAGRYLSTLQAKWLNDIYRKTQSSI